MVSVLRAFQSSEEGVFRRLFKGLHLRIYINIHFYFLVNILRESLSLLLFGVDLRR